MNSSSLYVHIPFCISKCDYCDFFSIGGCSCVADDYLDALISECRYYVQKYSVQSFKTIYIGGGTPSLLNPSQIKKLMDGIYSCVQINAAEEITFEANPETLSLEKLNALKDCGVNRLSCGIQSLNQQALNGVHRHCSVEKCIDALELIKENWNGSLNLDSISGLPFQNDEEFCSSLKKILSYKPDHVSLYTLTVEEGTALDKNIRQKKIKYDQDAADDQWFLGRDILFNEGFCQYEVSNFSKDGKYSKHNMTYWQLENYIGIGAGASGTFWTKKERWHNLENIKAYVDFWILNKGELPAEIEFLDDEIMEYEFLMMGLRTLNGLSTAEYKKRFNKDLIIRLGNSKVWKKFLAQKKAVQTENKCALTQEGLLFLNELLLDL